MAGEKVACLYAREAKDDMKTGVLVGAGIRNWDVHD